MILHNNLDPILFAVGGAEVRWYGLFFALGLIGMYLLTVWIFKREKIELKVLDSLGLYLFMGLIVGARLGHVLFYNFEYFSAHLIDIFKVWNGGLSSHGAAIGVFLAYLLWLFIKKEKFGKYADLMIVGMSLVAICVRIGNYFNSEIIGKATEGGWGVVFEKLGEDFPRHPSQLYEAALSLGIFIVLFVVYKKWYKKLPKLFLFFLYVTLYFVTRFFVEFYKERHILPDEFPLSMGQILSVLPLAIGLLYFGIIIFKKARR